MVLIKLGHITVQAEQISHIVHRSDGECELVMFNGRTILTNANPNDLKRQLQAFGARIVNVHNVTSEEE